MIKSRLLLLLFYSILFIACTKDDGDSIDHGIFNSNIIEEIQIGIDDKEKVLEVLGDPDGTVINTNHDTWYYAGEGFSLTIEKATGLVTTSQIFSSGITIASSEGPLIQTGVYPYTINNELTFDLTMRSTMTDVVEAFGLPTYNIDSGDPLPSPLVSLKEEVRTGRYKYIYFNTNNSSQSIEFSFSSDNIDNYEDEIITWTQLKHD